MANDSTADVNNTGDYAFIQAALSTLQQRVAEYYMAGSTLPGDGNNRHARAVEIRNAIVGIGGPLPIAIGSSLDGTAADNYGCPPDTVCIGGVCIINNNEQLSFED